MEKGDAYCGHLREQLKSWQRVFRSKHGRLPEPVDFEALQNDESARGKLTHAAYVALNRATDGGFAKVRCDEAPAYSCCVCQCGDNDSDAKQHIPGLTGLKPGRRAPVVGRSTEQTVRLARG